MFNIISALVVTGALSATGLACLMDLEDHAEDAAQSYVSSAEARFKDYEQMLPGVVEWVNVADKNVDSLLGK